SRRLNKDSNLLKLPNMKMLKLRLFALCLCCISQINYSQNLTNSLAACYPLDCNANDGFTNALHGTINGAVTCTTGHLGVPNTAMQFGGSTSDFIALPNSPFLKPTGTNPTITVSGWYCITSSAGQE